jgi:TIGR01777 family protein
MKIGITGASGFIGRAVQRLAASGGHEVIPYSRSPGPGARRFALETPPDLSGLDAVVHLAGESVLGLWTREKKRRIHRSRVEGTRRIVEALARDGSGPRTLICASAIGYYGETGETEVDELSGPGEGFLAGVCRDWENEARRAEDLGVRVVRVRVGFVLGRGGAMKRIGPVFRLGLGGRLGDGRQWMSGVHVDDVAGIFLWAAENPGVTGAFNAVMPEPFRNGEFTRAVAEIVRRPAVFPVPAWALRLALGELSGLLLDSIRVRPRQTVEAGYVFRFATLRAALQDVLTGRCGKH